MGIPHRLHGDTQKVFTHMVVHPLSIFYAVPSSVLSSNTCTVNDFLLKVLKQPLRSVFNMSILPLQNYLVINSCLVLWYSQAFTQFTTSPRLVEKYFSNKSSSETKTHFEYGLSKYYKQYQKCAYIGLVWLLDHPWYVAFISCPQFSFLLPHISAARFAASDLSSSPFPGLSIACVYTLFG